MAEIGKRIARKIDKAIHEFGMIDPGDKILIAVSGGKDSLALAYHLTRKSRNYPISFSVSAVHVRTDFSTYPIGSDFLDVLKEWGLETTIIDVPVRNRLKPGRKLNCYWCATQRRMELMNEARRCGANKIALGHHLDDILETFLMNIAGRSELSTMLPKMIYDKYPFTIVRPLAWVHETEIIEFVDRLGLEGVTCSCPWDSRSPRKTARRALEALCDGVPKRKDNIFRSLSNPVARYLPGEDTGRLE
jgi:tRNA 2-thiocytidine biosynthesis protein TtcA